MPMKDPSGRGIVRDSTLASPGSCSKALPRSVDLRSRTTPAVSKRVTGPIHSSQTTNVSGGKYCRCCGRENSPGPLPLRPIVLARQLARWLEEIELGIPGGEHGDSPVYQASHGAHPLRWRRRDFGRVYPRRCPRPGQTRVGGRKSRTAHAACRERGLPRFRRLRSRAAQRPPPSHADPDQVRCPPRRTIAPDRDRDGKNQEHLDGRHRRCGLPQL